MGLFYLSWNYDTNPLENDHLPHSHDQRGELTDFSAEIEEVDLEDFENSAFPLAILYGFIQIVYYWQNQLFVQKQKKIPVSKTKPRPKEFFHIFQEKPYLFITDTAPPFFSSQRA